MSDINWRDGKYIGPWCHHCEQPITERDIIRTPPEDIGGGVMQTTLMCVRCLKGPEGDE